MWGLKDSYTLLGSKHFIKQLNIPPTMHTTENTNAVVKIGRSMCVNCHFGVQTLSLLSTRYILSFQSIAIGVTQHKHTVP
jgi:hypothetical protein